MLTSAFCVYFVDAVETCFYEYMLKQVWFLFI